MSSYNNYSNIFVTMSMKNKFINWFSWISELAFKVFLLLAASQCTSIPSSVSNCFRLQQIASYVILHYVHDLVTNFGLL